ncbi:MAG: S8 family serine peptidase [Bacteroidota bacterium]
MQILTAQKRYFYAVYFKSKDTLAYKIQQPERYLSARAIARKQKLNVNIDWYDLPVDTSCLNKLQSKQAHILAVSKWMNAALVGLNDEKEIERIKQLSIVASVKSMGYDFNSKRNTDQKAYRENLKPWLEKNFMQSTKDSALIKRFRFQQEQVNLYQVKHQFAEGVWIAVIDAGFKYVDVLPVFNQLQTTFTYDFVEQESDVFDDDEHGTAVLSCMAATNAPFVGAASKASYVLMRTEDASREFPYEEFYWLCAAETADSLGVDIINSSLGYNEFGDEQFDYKHKHLNGKTILITKAAELAVRKGMFVVCSAGNEGDKEWEKIVAPADGEHVLTVGGVDMQGKFVSFSSVGPTADKRIKPDVVALADKVCIANATGGFDFGNGTSYATPVVTSMLAAHWNNIQTNEIDVLLKRIKLASSQFYQPNSVLGYGIPNLLWLVVNENNIPKDSVLEIERKQVKIIVNMIAKESGKVDVFVHNKEGNYRLNTVEMVNKGFNRFTLTLKPQFANIPVYLQVKLGDEILIKSIVK